MDKATYLARVCDRGAGRLGVSSLETGVKLGLTLTFCFVDSTGFALLRRDVGLAAGADTP